METIARAELRPTLDKIIRETEITDIHTHIYPEAFGGLLLWGIDELVTYHYLIAETFRYVDMPHEKYFSLPKHEQAELIWKTLFLDRSPISEAQRGVLTVLAKLKLDTASRDLVGMRRYFTAKSVSEYTDIVFQTANVKEVVMTNER